MSDRLYNSRARGVLLSLWKWAKRQHNITWGSWWEPRTSCSPAQRVGVRDSSRDSCGAAVAALGHPKGHRAPTPLHFHFSVNALSFCPHHPRGGRGWCGYIGRQTASCVVTCVVQPKKILTELFVDAGLCGGFVPGCTEHGEQPRSINSSVSSGGI